MTGELQRLSSQAEMLPIMRTHGGLLPSPELRQLQTTIRREVADGIVKKVQVRIATDVTIDAMDSIKEVDDHRHLRAEGNQTLNALLAEVELNHAHYVGRIQRGGLF